MQKVWNNQMKEVDRNTGVGDRDLMRDCGSKGKHMEGELEEEVG